jgi:hypothetical protein
MSQPNTLFRNFCDHCGQFDLSERLEPRYGTHCGELFCNDCHKFTKKVAAPQKKAPEPSILRLLQNSSLERWEIDFLKTIAYQRQHTKGEKIVIAHINTKNKPRT